MEPQRAKYFVVSSSEAFTESFLILFFDFFILIMTSKYLSNYDQTFPVGVRDDINGEDLLSFDQKDTLFTLWLSIR